MGLRGRRVLGALMLGTFLSAMPLVASFHADGVGLVAPKAFAKDGKDDRGGDRDDRGGGDRGKGGNGGGGDRGGDDDSGSRGGGRSGGDDDGSRGGGSDDDGADNHGGRGGDDDGSDDHGGRGGDDDGSDDHGGRGGDDDGEDGGRGRGRGVSGGGASTLPEGGGGGVRAVMLERSATGVEVTYSNGIKEEIENGRFEQKDAAGRTVIERPATAADFARLNANARNSGLAVPAGAGTPRVEAAGGAIEVRYPNGWKEELEGGRYELKDPNNNTVVERPATAADVRRLRALAGG